MFFHFLAYIELPLQKYIKCLSSHQVHYQNFIVYRGKDIAVLFSGLLKGIGEGTLVTIWLKIEQKLYISMLLLCYN